MSARDIFPHSKSITVPNFSRKSVPSRPAASVGSEQTKNVCVYSRLFSKKVTVCSPFTSRASPVTPCGFVCVITTPRLDTACCSIETLDPVSIIRLLDSPSISTETVGVPCSSKMEHVVVAAASSVVLRWKEGAASLHTVHSFP